MRCRRVTPQASRAGFLHYYDDVPPAPRPPSPLRELLRQAGRAVLGYGVLALAVIALDRLGVFDIVLTR